MCPSAKDPLSSTIQAPYIYIFQRSQSRTLFQEYNAREPIIQIPEVNTAHSALIVQLTVDIEGVVARIFKLPYPLTRHRSVIKWGVEFIAPGRPIAVTVPVVVAEQVVAVGLRTTANLQGLVNRGKEVFGQIWDNSCDGLQVALRVTGVEAPEEVPE